jgi:hydrogenase-4 component B
VSAPIALLLAAIVLTGVSGVPGLFARRGSRGGERAAAALMAIGSISGIAAGASAWFARAPAGLDLPWPVPAGRLLLRLDALAGMFLVQVFLVALLGAIYGLSYWPEAEHEDSGRRLRLFYGTLTAGLATLVAARNSALFLVGWEAIALSSFLLVTTEDRQRPVRESGFVYLAATRVSALFLFGFFALLHAVTGTFDFALPASAALRPGQATALFVLALFGFGLKAGVMPLHLWLPGAHANAPSHVSALMSGVLIKTGIYGLLRTLSFFPHPPAWWGGLLVGIGAASGILGLAFALGQRDVKRLLAYSSIENVGIIVLGIGIAVLGRAIGSGELIALGMAGALLHVWNHGLFKALLFLAAGAVAHATGTREIDRLGGLAKRMPWTALAFLTGAVAICGLPPLNGFVSELFLYIGLFRSAAIQGGRIWLAGALGAPALALIGAMAVACFVRVFGAVFLGAPRTGDAEGAHEPDRRMLATMAVLAIACAVIGLAPILAVPVLERATAAWVGEADLVPAALAELAPLGWLSATGALLAALAGVAALALRALIRRRGSAAAVTWGCGYAAPSASMQYTSSSFAEMLVGFFGWALRPRIHEPLVRGPFPPPTRFRSEVPDTVLDRLVLPAVDRIVWVSTRIKRLQQGSVHAYLLYVLVALVVGLVWWR